MEGEGDCERCFLNAEKRSKIELELREVIAIIGYCFLQVASREIEATTSYPFTRYLKATV